MMSRFGTSPYLRPAARRWDRFAFAAALISASWRSISATSFGISAMSKIATSSLTTSAGDLAVDAALDDGPDEELRELQLEERS
jgi:hypothetical protein